MASTSEVKVIISAVDKASADMKKVGNAFAAQADKMKKVGTVATGVGLSAGFLAKQLIDAAAEFEQTQVAFTTMLGSAEQANKLLQDLAQFGAKTPFQLREVEEASKRLLAYGFSAEEVIPTLRSLGDVSASLGTDKLPNLITAFGQIRAKGKLAGQELLQLREAGFNLADAMGITNAELEEMVSKSLVSFEDVALAFQRVTSEGGRFFNGMENQSRTFLGIMSSLADQVALFSREGGKPLIEALKGIAEQTVRLVESFNQFAKANPELVKWLGLAAAAVAAILVPLGTFVVMLGFLAAGISAVTVAGLVLTAQIGLIVIAVAALIGIIVILIRNHDEIAAKAKEVWQNYGGIIKAAFAIVSPPLSALISALQLIISNHDAILSIAKNVWESIPDFVKSGVASMIANINPLFGVLKNLLDLFNQIRATAERIGGGVGETAGKIRGLVPFAEGGIVTRPTPALVGEAGPEAIIPLSKLGRGGGQVNINIRMDSPMFLDRDAGRIFGRQLIDELKNSYGGVA